MKKQEVIIFVGASGTGKTTFLNYLEEKGLIEKAITSTTRPMRDGEVDGIDYNFVSKEKMFKMYESDELCEPPNEHAGNFYGCSKAALFSDKPVGIIVDPNGANIIGDNLRVDNRFNVKTVFLSPITKNEMILRLENRGSSKKEIEDRIEVYEKESNWGQKIKPNLILKTEENKTMEENFSSFEKKVIGMLKKIVRKIKR